VDGRVLMPATSYVVTAWEAAAAAAETPAPEFAAAFADVAIHQAVVATRGQKITLAVQLAPAGKFYVRARRPLPCRHGPLLPSRSSEVARARDTARQSLHPPCIMHPAEALRGRNGYA